MRRPVPIIRLIGIGIILFAVFEAWRGSFLAFAFLGVVVMRVAGGWASTRSSSVGDNDYASRLHRMSRDLSRSGTWPPNP
jgi:hypothetical protein